MPQSNCPKACLVDQHRDSQTESSAGLICSDPLRAVLAYRFSHLYVRLPIAASGIIKNVTDRALDLKA
jgi:hypothetical protein